MSFRENSYIFDSMLKRILFILTLALSLSVSAMNTPTLNTPANNAVLNGFDVFIYVNSVTGATGYQIQFDTLATFNSPFLKNDTLSVYYEYSPDLKVGKTYYWRARCYKAGDTSAWSLSRTFSTTGIMSLNTPPSNTSGPIKNLIAMSMGISVNNRYIFEADTNAAFSSPLRVLKVSSDYFFQDSTLFSFSRNIYWRCRAYNKYGDTTGWSPTWKYTTLSQAPIDGSTNLMNIDPRYLVSWTNAGIASVELQCDSLSSFNTPGIIQRMIPSGKNLDTLKDLKFGQTYFYRIRHVYGNYTSAWSVVRTVRVYANGNINSPYAGQSMGINGAAVSWRLLNGTLGHLQVFTDTVNSTLLFDTLATQFATISKLLDLNRNYYFRVRYEHAKDTSPWLNSYFKTNTGQVNLGQPYSNAVNQPVRLRFNFRKQPWAINHVMEIDTGTTFGPNRSVYFIHTDSFKYDGSYYHYIDTSLAYGAKYVWRVYAIKAPGDTAQPTTSTFTTMAKPVNYYPPNNFIGIGTSTNGLVTGITGSTYIQWELDSSALFNSPHKMEGTDPHVPDDFTPQYIGLNFPSDFRFQTTYYWRARCLNSVDTSDWSLPFNFLTTQRVWLDSPVNNSINLLPNQKLKWGVQGSSSEQRYQYQLATDSSFLTAPVITLPAGSSSQTNISCNYATKYYWRARACHSKDTSTWSLIYNFTVMNPPAIGVPPLIAPANGASNLLPSNITLSWGTAANAQSYDVEVASDASFSTVLASGNTPGNGIYFTGAQYKTRYYWHVRGKYNNLVGNWSTARWFETAPPTGINEAILENMFNLFPNPASKSVNINSSLEMEVEIMDLSGQVVYKSENTGRSFEIETSSWKTGVYLVRAKTATGISVQKLVLTN